MNRLKNKIAIITGGTKGIGLATAKLFKKEGAKVIVCSRNKNNMNIRGIDYYKVDLTNTENCNNFVEHVIKKYKKIDILVNNAGTVKDRTTIKMTDDEFNSVINTNLKGAFNMVRLIGATMCRQKYGSIINVSSVVGQQGNFGQANYAASKAGLEAMTKCWAKEFTIHGENIRVNAVAPGGVLTDIFAKTPENVINSFANKSLLKRLATTNEIAHAILFLASDESSYITSTTINVNGGLTL